jgi:uncharacterized protein
MARLLPTRPDVEQVRRQAKDLLSAARRADPAARERIRTVSDRESLAAAQLAVAREYGFASWTRLKQEVERRAVLNGRGVDRLEALLANEPHARNAQARTLARPPPGR